MQNLTLLKIFCNTFHVQFELLQTPYCRLLQIPILLQYIVCSLLLQVLPMLQSVLNSLLRNKRYL